MAVTPLGRLNTLRMVARSSDRNDDWLKAILQPPCGPPLALASPSFDKGRTGRPKPSTAQRKREGSEKALPLWMLAFASAGSRGYPHPPRRRPICSTPRVPCRTWRNPARESDGSDPSRLTVRAKSIVNLTLTAQTPPRTPVRHGRCKAVSAQRNLAMRLGKNGTEMCHLRWARRR